MKNLLALALIVLVKSAFAQKDTVGLNVPFVNNTVVYERVFAVPNATKALLYSNAGIWMAETHPFVQDTQLQLADPGPSRLIGRVKASTLLTDKYLWQTSYSYINYSFTVQIDCKDNAYRVRIYNIQDIVNTDYTPVDNFMLALISPKPSYTLANNAVLKVPDLKQRFGALNLIIGNVMADINKSMVMADNGF